MEVRQYFFICPTVIIALGWEQLEAGSVLQSTALHGPGSAAGDLSCH
jgi:hypothetical protein